MLVRSILPALSMVYAASGLDISGQKDAIHILVTSTTTMSLPFTLVPRQWTPSPLPIWSEPSPAPIWSDPSPAPVWSDPSPAPIWSDPSPAPVWSAPPIWSEPAAPIWTSPSVSEPAPTPLPPSPTAPLPHPSQTPPTPSPPNPKQTLSNAIIAAVFFGGFFAVAIAGGLVACVMRKCRTARGKAGVGEEGRDADVELGVREKTKADCTARDAMAGGGETATAASLPLPAGHVRWSREGGWFVH